MAERRLAELADLYRIPLWIIARPFYTVLPMSVLFRLATAKGTIMAVLSRRRWEVLRRIGEVDLEVSASERRRIARQHLQFVERERLANLWPCMRGFPGSGKVNVVGQHHLDEALNAGRGAIIVTQHFGYARLLKPILISNGYRALLIGPPRDLRIRGFPPLTRLGRSVRSGALRLPWPAENEIWARMAGYDLTAELNIRPHLAALGRNEILISLPEGRGGHRLDRVSMMGIDVLMSPTVMSMARHTGAAVLPAFVDDDASSRDLMGIRLVIQPPLALPADGRGRTSAATDVQSLTDVFESWIRASPHLWLAWSGPPLGWWGRRAPRATG